MMALLQHPNILPIYEVGQDEKHPYLVMEYASGGTLSQSLGGKPMPPQKAAELAAVLARAVHCAHVHGVIHRDLKPSNVLLAADGTPKIGDFGLAKCFESPTDHTQTGQLLGTPSYMAPEQLGNAAAKLGPSVDVYALGATLYELLSGRPPFLADNPLHTLHMVRSQEPISLCRLQPKMPADLDTICLKCLEKEPAAPLPERQALAEDLERFVRGEPIAARPAGRLERCRRWSGSHRAAAALIAGAILSLAAILALVLAFNHRLAGELARTNVEHGRLLATKERLHRELTNAVAGRLDSDLRELAAVPSTMATLLEHRDDWDETGLERTIRDMLRKSPLIFGLCVAMEPFQWRADRQDFALYMYRSSKGLASRQLLPPWYRPIYRQWDWYRPVRDSASGRWGEPYVGLGGDRTPMVTFSVPIRRHGRFVGVVAADLAIDYFHKLRASLDELEPGPDCYCFLVSTGGQILAHSDDRYAFPRPKSNLDRLQLDVGCRRLLGSTGEEKDGLATAIDPVSGKAATFLFLENSIRGLDVCDRQTVARRSGKGQQIGHPVPTRLRPFFPYIVQMEQRGPHLGRIRAAGQNLVDHKPVTADHVADQRHGIFAPGSFNVATPSRIIPGTSSTGVEPRLARCGNWSRLLTIFRRHVPSSSFSQDSSTAGGVFWPLPEILRTSQASVAWKQDLDQQADAIGVGLGRADVAQPGAFGADDETAGAGRLEGRHFLQCLGVDTDAGMDRQAREILMDQGHRRRRFHHQAVDAPLNIVGNLVQQERKIALRDFQIESDAELYAMVVAILDGAYRCGNGGIHGPDDAGSSQRPRRKPHRRRWLRLPKAFPTTRPARATQANVDRS